MLKVKIHTFSSMQNITPKYKEFNELWHRCIKSMNSIVAAYGYNGLTFGNISKLTYIPEETLETYFINETMLLKLYDNFIELHPIMKLQAGKFQLN